MDYNKFQDYFNEKDKFSKSNGMKVVKVERGYSEVEMMISDSNLNFVNLLHGGALYTLADVAAGVASLSYGVTCVTLNSSINYIKSANCGKVKAIANEISRGRKVSVYEVKINDESENLLVKCLMTMYITGHEIEMEL